MATARRLLPPARPPSTRWSLWLVAGLTAISTGAMLGLSQRADERFNPYRWGPLWLESPTRPITFALEFTFVTVLEIGNFRPLGRIVEHLNYLVVEALAVTTGLPVHVVLGLTRLVSAIGVGLLVVVLARRLAGVDSWIPAVAAGAFASLLVPFGNLSSMVVFSGMYLQTTALVVLAALLFASPARYRPGPLRWPRLVGFGLFGVAVALFNELAWLAVPVAGATLLAQLLLRGRPWRRWWSLPAVRAGVAALGGFAAVAIPVRIVLANACAAPGRSCYVATSPTPSGVTPMLVLKRAVSGLPLPAWGVRRFGELGETIVDVAFDVRFLPALLVAAAVSAAVLLWPRRADATDDPDGVDPTDDTDRTDERADGDTDDRDDRPGAAAAAADDQDSLSDGRTAVLVAVVGAAFVLAGSLLSALSPVLQELEHPFIGWRESPVLFVGWALLLGAAGGWGLQRLPARAGRVLLAAVASLGVAAAVVGTGLQHDRDARDARLLLADRIGVEMASFEVSEQADARRCGLLEEFARLHADRSSQTDRIVESLATAARVRHDQPFCSRGAP